MVLSAIDLFSGAGGAGWAGILAGWQPVCYVENEPHCIGVLRQRMRDGIFADADIWTDARTFDGNPWRGVDLVTAGFPCQPFSQAGKGRIRTTPLFGAAEDERNMWPTTARIIGECRPRHVLLENSPTLLDHRTDYYIRTVLRDLAALGYDARWCVLGADDVGAPHARRRLWIRAADTHGACGDGQEVTVTAHDGAHPNAHGRRFEASREPQHGDEQSQPRSEPDGLGQAGRRQGQVEVPWRAEAMPPIRRVADGLAEWRSEVAAIGNGWVPLVAATAWRLLGRDWR